MKAKQSVRSAGMQRVRLSSRSGSILRQQISAALFVGTGCTLAATAASAQAQQDQAVEEIVVTATRRNATITDIPYSISAISSASLEDNHVASISDLTKMIAGVAFVDAGPSARSNIVLRGINANASDQQGTSRQLSTVSPVSTYMGETPLFLALQIDDIERVEVLRGPQGTLYGSGSLAGTLRFIPNKPDPTGFHAAVDGDVASVTETNQYNRGLSGVVNAPISATSALRLSAGFQHYAGFIDEDYLVRTGAPSTAVNSPIGIPVGSDPANPDFSHLVFDPKKGANDADLWHVRASFLVAPTEQFSALITYYHQENRTSGVQAHSPNLVGSVDATPAENPFYSPQYPSLFPTGGVIFPQSHNYMADNSFLLKDQRHADLVSADLTWQLGFATLSSSTSYYKDAGHNVADNTGLLSLYPSFYGFIPRMVDYMLTSDDLKGTVEELRLVSTAGTAIDYVAGVFYQKLDTTFSEMQWLPGQTYYGALVGYPGANAATLGDLSAISDNSSTFKDRALFGELTWHITDKWQATGGARLFKQDFSVSDSTAFPFCGPACSSFNPPDSLGTTFVQQGYSVNDHILKLNTSYRFSKTLNTYFNYAEGFRRGGANGIPVSGPFAGNPALLVYTPDKTQNYEVGVKGTVGQAQYSAALFYINWKNFQVDATAIASAIPIAVNGGDAHSKGVEFELDGELARGLTYRLGYSYADARVANDFTVYDYNTSHELVGLIESKSGDPLPNAPKQSVTASLDYAHQLAGGLAGWAGKAHLDASYRSSTQSQLVSANPANPPPFQIDAFSIWDASVGLVAPHGVHADLYIQNIFNALGVTGGSDQGAVGRRAEHFFVTRPRTVGLRVGYSF